MKHLTNKPKLKLINYKQMKKTMIYVLTGLFLLVLFFACSSARYTNGKGKMKKDQTHGYCYYPVFQKTNNR